jgi:hypothetical protein
VLDAEPLETVQLELNPVDGSANTRLFYDTKPLVDRPVVKDFPIVIGRSLYPSWMAWIGLGEPGYQTNLMMMRATLSTGRLCSPLGLWARWFLEGRSLSHCSAGLHQVIYVGQTNHACFSRLTSHCAEFYYTAKPRGRLRYIFTMGHMNGHSLDRYVRRFII